MSAAEVRCHYCKVARRDLVAGSDCPFAPFGKHYYSKPPKPVKKPWAPKPVEPPRLHPFAAQGLAPWPGWKGAKK